MWKYVQFMLESAQIRNLNMLPIRAPLTLKLCKTDSSTYLPFKRKTLAKWMQVHYKNVFSGSKTKKLIWLATLKMIVLPRCRLFYWMELNDMAALLLLIKKTLIGTNRWCVLLRVPWPDYIVFIFQVLCYHQRLWGSWFSGNISCLSVIVFGKAT